MPVSVPLSVPSVVSGSFGRPLRQPPSPRYKYTTAFENELRAVVRDDRASDLERHAAVAVLRSWNIQLDPVLYPFVPARPGRGRRRKTVPQGFEGGRL